MPATDDVEPLFANAVHPIAAAGLLIGGLCAIWTFVMGITGWYKDPVLLNAFFLVIAIETGGLAWGLRQTAKLGYGYGRQVGAGMLIAMTAGVVIIGSSLLFTTVAFPEYFTELTEMNRRMLIAQGKSSSEIEAELRAAAAMQTPFANALAGFFGTLITGAIASAVIAIWIRERPAKL
jgi:hypothetical protein